MGFKHLDPVREDEATLELACRDTAMKEVARIVALFLTAADDQLVVFQLNDISFSLNPATAKVIQKPAVTGLLNVVGRIPFCLHLRDAVEATLKLFKTQQQRAVEKG